MAFGSEVLLKYSPSRRRHHGGGVPVVGVHATNQVRLSPRLEALLHHRAQRAANRYYAPQIAALKAQRRGVVRTYRQSVSSTKNAVGAAQAQLSQIQKGLKHSGLKGSFLQQTRSDLASRQQSLGQAIPFLTQDARAQKQSGLAGIQQDIIGARVDRAQDASSKLYSLEQKAYTSGASAASDRQDNQRLHALHRRQHRRNVSQAVHTGMNLLATAPTSGEGSVPWSADSVKHFGSEGDAWRNFEGILAGQSDVNHSQAQAAIEVIRRRLAKHWGQPWAGVP
jgi:hypothetical protein